MEFGYAEKQDYRGEVWKEKQESSSREREEHKQQISPAGGQEG